MPPGIPTKAGPSLAGEDTGGVIKWVPAWVWVLLRSIGPDFDVKEMSEELRRAAEDPQLQVVILGESLLTARKVGEDIRLACSRWIEKARNRE